MATIAQFNQDQNQQQQTTNQGGGGQVLTSNAGGGATGVSPSTPTGSYSPPRAPLSGTPNIQQYLQANQGAGQNLSQGIQNNVQSQAQGLNNQVSSDQQNLSSQYQPLQQNVNGGQQAIQTAFQNPQQLLDAYNAAKTSSSNQPLNNTQQQSLNQYNQYQQAATGGYNPAIQSYNNSAQQYGNTLQNQLSNIQDQATNANTEMGRGQLLQNAIGQPNYNMGQQTLDSLFLQAQPGVANQLKQNLGNIASQSGQNVNAFNQDTQAKIAALQGLSAQNQQYAQNLFNNGIAGSTDPNQQGLSGIASNVANEYTQAQANAPTAVANMQASATANQFTPDQLQQLGLQDNTNAWGVNLNPYINATPLLAANAGGNAQVANANEFNRYNALNQLAGGPAGTAQASIFGGATQAGGFNPISFDTSAFQTAVQNQQAALNGADLQNELQKIEPGIQSAWGGDTALYGDVVGKINQLTQQNKSPQEIMDALKDTNYGNSLANNYGAYISGQGLNPGFVDMGSAAYGKALDPLQNWINKTYSPAANDILGTNAPVVTPKNNIQKPAPPAPTRPASWNPSGTGGFSF